MSNALMSAAWRLDLPMTEKVVLVALADCANEQGVTWIAIRSKRAEKLDLLTMTSLSERAVQNAIKALVIGGHLTRVETVGRGVTYTVHPRTACTPAGDAPPQVVPPAGDAQTPAPRAPKPSVTPIPLDADASNGKARARIPASAQAYVEVWNGMAERVGLAKVAAFDKKRASALKARVADHGPDSFATAVAAVARSKFCLGENDRGWRADIGFLLRPGNYLKLLEGGFDPPGCTGPPAVVLEEKWSPEQRAEYLQRYASAA